jgi:hypothetical protein
LRLSIVASYSQTRSWRKNRGLVCQPLGLLDNASLAASREELRVLSFSVFINLI